MALAAVYFQDIDIHVIVSLKEKEIEDIQGFGVNMSFISLSEVKKIYIS